MKTPFLRTHNSSSSAPAGNSERHWTEALSPKARRVTVINEAVIRVFQATPDASSVTTNQAASGPYPNTLQKTPAFAETTNTTSNVHTDPQQNYYFDTSQVKSKPTVPAASTATNVSSSATDRVNQLAAPASDILKTIKDLTNV